MDRFGIKLPWWRRRSYKYAILAKVEYNVLDERILRVVPSDSYVELEDGAQYIVLLAAEPSLSASVDKYGD